MSPELRGKPIATVVAGSTKITSISPFAYTVGVHPSFTSEDTARLFPWLKIIPENPEWNEKFHQALGKRLGEFGTATRTGEGWGTVKLSRPQGQTESLFREIKNHLSEKLNLSCVSLGTGDTDMISLTCAQAVYPGGIIGCPTGKEKEVLGAYSVLMIPGLDEKTKQKLKDNNIRTMEDFYAIPENQGVKYFGNGTRELYQAMGGH